VTILSNKLIRDEVYYIAIFKSKNYAVQLHYYLEKKGYRNFQLISTPCHLSAGCSFSIKFFDLKDIEIFRSEINTFDSIIHSIYQVQRENGKRKTKRLNDVI